MYKQRAECVVRYRAVVNFLSVGIRARRDGVIYSIDERDKSPSMLYQGLGSEQRVLCLCLGQVWEDNNSLLSIDVFHAPTPETEGQIAMVGCVIT